MHHVLHFVSYITVPPLTLHTDAEENLQKYTLYLKLRGTVKLTAKVPCFWAICLYTNKGLCVNFSMSVILFRFYFLFLVLMFNEKTHFILWRLEADNRRMPQVSQVTFHRAKAQWIQHKLYVWSPPTAIEETMNTLQVNQVNHPSAPTFARGKKKCSTHLLYEQPWVQSADWNFRLRLFFPASGRQGVARMLIHSEIS